MALRRGQPDNALDAWLWRNLAMLSSNDGDAPTARRFVEAGPEAVPGAT